MKKTVLFLVALPLMFACNNEPKDSVETADSTNNAKADPSSVDTASNSVKVSESTSSFMVDAANGGMTEVQAGTVAKDKALSQRVKSFGDMMVMDHEKAGAELKALATSKNVSLPAAIGDDHQKKIDSLGNKTGKDFDKAYMKMMKDDHEKTINLFEKNSNSDDAEVKAFVNKTLPTLRSHLDSVNAIIKGMK